MSIKGEIIELTEEYFYFFGFCEITMDGEKKYP